jgi:capsular exopolysaccharide synthesis family protein
MTPEKDQVDIRAWVIRILKNWYWFVLSCAIVGTFGLYNYFTTTKKFVVDASIMLRSNEGMGMSDVDPMSMLGMGTNKVTEDEVEVLTSRDIMLQVINELDLRVEYRKLDAMKWVGQYPKHDLTINFPPVFMDTLLKGTRVELKVRKNDYKVKVRYGFWERSRHTVKDLTIPFETCVGPLSFVINDPEEIEVGDKFKMYTSPRLSLVNSYKMKIEAEPVNKDSKIIRIATTSDMPGLSRDFIRKQIELYNMDAVIDKNIMASNTAAFIDERLKLIEAELSVAEEDVERYKEQNHIVSLADETEFLVKESIEYRRRLAEKETQLQLVQFVEDFVKDDTKKGSLIPSNLGISNDALVGLIGQYNGLLMRRMRVQRTATGENPIVAQMDSQLELLRGNIEASIDNVRSTLLISQKSLTDRYEVAENQRQYVPSQEREFREIVRQKQLKEQLYLYLYKKREENALTLASTVTPAKIVAAPQMNPNPVSPRLLFYAMACLFFGVGIPFGCMFLYDIMNNRISSDSKELERKLKVPFGGVLVKNHRGEHVAIRDNENSVSSELFRTLRTNLRFMQPVDSNCPVMLVTSSINGEGKSYVATNLAISMAMLGKRVALVGLDIRKPMLANYLNLPSQGCLTSYLADSAYKLEDTLVPSNITNLDIIPAGIVPPNPSELLLSERLDELFVELRAKYDCVVVDSAPVAMVSDTFQLARVCDMTVYVSRANYTTFELVDFINQVHEHQRLPKIVAVLNGADAKSVGYGYGYGYGHEKR